MLIAGDVKKIHVTRLSYSGAAAIVTRLSLGVLWLAGVVWLVAAYAHAASPPLLPELSPLDQALSHITSEDEAVREAALRVVIEQGDSTVIPPLEDIRATADRPVRLAIKPVMDLLKNRAKLESPEADARRSAATDLGTLGRPVAIPWLEQAAAKESSKWVRYTMQESAALLKLAGDDQAAKQVAVNTLGRLASQNAVPALQEMVNVGTAEGASEVQQSLAEAAHASIERIETWAAWSAAIETGFRGVSLSSILLIMSVGLAIIFGLMGVINMAHGELMMVGAYATFMTQEAFRAFLPISTLK